MTCYSKAIWNHSNTITHHKKSKHSKQEWKIKTTFWSNLLNCKWIHKLVNHFKETLPERGNKTSSFMENHRAKGKEKWDRRQHIDCWVCNTEIKISYVQWEKWMNFKLFKWAWNHHMMDASCRALYSAYWQLKVLKNTLYSMKAPERSKVTKNCAV